MFGSAILDVAIGLSFLFFILSLVVTSAREILEGWTQTRAVHLERGLRELLRDRQGTGLASQIYNHPLINSLFRGQYEPRRLRTSLWSNFLRTLRMRVDSWGRYPIRSNLPAYIPARNFASALLDLAARGEVTAEGDGTAHDTAAVTFEQVRAGIAANIANPDVRRAVLLALDGAKGDLDQARANIESWFDSGMDRVSGWYRKHTQWVLFWMGLAIAIGLNVNALEVVRSLYQNDAMRQAIVAEAQATVTRAGSDAHDDAAFFRAIGCPEAAAPAPAPAPGAAAPAAPVSAASAGTIAAPSAPAPAPAAASRQVAAPRPVAAPPATGRAVAAPPAPARAVAASQVQPGAPADHRSCAQRRLDELPFPVGWGDRTIAWPWSEAGKDGKWWSDSDFPWRSFPGWLITALALTLGAPFWFDLLNKMMVIRSTVKPHEKSPEEASEDRQRGGNR